MMNGGKQMLSRDEQEVPWELAASPAATQNLFFLSRNLWILLMENTLLATEFFLVRLMYYIFDSNPYVLHGKCKFYWN